jgi:lipocalin-like protein
MRSNFVLLVSVVATLFSTAATAQCNFSVVGTWKLVSVASTTDKDETNKAALGQHPSGLLTYTADGRMMAIISDDGLRRTLHVYLRQGGASCRSRFAPKLGEH